MIFLYSCKDEKKKDVETTKTTGVSKDLTSLNDKIAKEPNNANLYNLRAKYHIKAQDIGAAARDINKALSLDSSKADYYLTASDVFFMTKKTAESKSALEKCVELDPKNVDCLLKLAELYLYVQQHETSINYVNKALKVDVNNPKAYFIKGMNFKEMGDTSSAISSMQTTVEQDPDYYHAYVQLGLLFAAKKNRLALDYYNNALNINPKSVEAHYNKSLFLQKIGELDRAREGYNIILQIDSTYSYAHYNLGYIEFEYKQNYPEALKHFTRASRTNPDYANALYMRGLTQEKLGNPAAAKADYIQVMHIDGEHEDAFAALKRLK